MIDDSNFTVGNSVIMLVDHQTGTVGWVKSLPQQTVITGCRVLARMALAYDMPLILTTTVEQQVGPTGPARPDRAPDQPRWLGRSRATWPSPAAPLTRRSRRMARRRAGWRWLGF